MLLLLSQFDLDMSNDHDESKNPKDREKYGKRVIFNEEIWTTAACYNIMQATLHMRWFMDEYEWFISTENSPHTMKCRRMKKAENAIGPSHLFSTYWDVLTGKRDLNNHYFYTIKINQLN